jgi:hypothetical protein
LKRIAVKMKKILYLSQFEKRKSQKNDIFIYNYSRSSAKIQNFSQLIRINAHSLPEYSNEVKDIVTELKKLSLQKL